MTSAREVTCRPLLQRTLWFFAGLGAAGAILVTVRLAFRGELLDVWLGVGLVLVLGGIPSLFGATARVSADAYGLHIRKRLRRRSVPWHDIADLCVHLRNERNHRAPEARRVGLALRNGRRLLLPLPRSWSPEDRPEFDAKLDALRALHRRYGAPESSHVPVISYRSAGRGTAGPLSLCVLLLAGAGVAAAFVPYAASREQAWKSVAPCTAGTPAAERGECLSTLPAVIARTDDNPPEQRNWLYFADGRPLERLGVSREAAQRFQPGDRVELTVWRREVMEVAGERYVWQEHVTPAGDVSVIAALLALGAGYPGATLLMRLRGRRLPDDEILPSALPFAGVLVGTALWLLPLCYLHPTAPPGSPEALTWTAAGSLATLGLFARAWHATRIRTPGKAGATKDPADQEVFLAARFLEHTDYNPYGFGTHIVVGGGTLAVTPHPGPGLFAAKHIPVERLTVKDVRRVRGGDGDTVPGTWHIAELDDAGTPVRLAAAPDDLHRIIRELRPAPAGSRGEPGHSGR